MVTIKLWLESEGYTVWLDLDQMSGSTLETMARAVEEAECFVMVRTDDGTRHTRLTYRILTRVILNRQVVSDAYKNSPNCPGPPGALTQPPRAPQCIYALCCSCVGAHGA